MLSDVYVIAHDEAVRMRMKKRRKTTTGGGSFLLSTASVRDRPSMVVSTIVSLALKRE